VTRRASRGVSPHLVLANGIQGDVGRSTEPNTVPRVVHDVTRSELSREILAHSTTKRALADANAEIARLRAIVAAYQETAVVS